MTDYISREMTIDAICRLCNANFEEDPCEPSECEMMSLLRKIPAADVRPVVLCRDCKHNNACLTQAFVEEESKAPFDRNTFFCADGERGSYA